MIVGIDLGISTTKFVVIDENGDALRHVIKLEPMTIEMI